MSNPWEMLTGLSEPPKIEADKESIKKHITIRYDSYGDGEVREIGAGSNSAKAIEMAQNGIKDSAFIAKETGLTERYVRAILVRRKLIDSKRLGAPGRPVDCFDLNGVFIKRYKSIFYAAKELQMSDTNIRRSAVSNGTKRAGQYYWRLAND